ncbi:FliH/SctL family protein [Planctomicrobium sp. SH664]|uniref:FliH/SctL family protein n=1 Tax=Planctomicrobium sp. SH664 TaxID=3448125 RepID=UPI003F5B835B
MFRTEIRWSAPPVNVRIRTGSPSTDDRAGSPRAPLTFPAGLPDLSSQVSRPPPPAPPTVDLSPLFGNLHAAVEHLEERRHQSLQELQQVAIELAVAAASQLTFRAIEADQFGVEMLVQQAIDRLGLHEPLQLALHPADLELLQRSEEGEAFFAEQSLQIRSDATLERGACRMESGTRILISDIASRLTEIRRHWLEELDDSQIERRRPQADSRTMRRFPDRRETA